MQYRLIYVLGATNCGKSTLLEKAAEFSNLVGLVQVGKELRTRHSPEYFKGLGAMEWTELEVREIFHKQVQQAMDAGKKIILIDGNPRSIEQMDMVGNYTSKATEEFWFLHADEEQRLQWIDKRDGTPEQKALSTARLRNDSVQLYPLLHQLLMQLHTVRAMRMYEGFDYERFCKGMVLRCPE